MCIKMEAAKLKLDINVSMIMIEVGLENQLILKIENKMAVSDTVSLQILGEPKKIGYWSWFLGHRYDKYKNNLDIELKPYESRNITITTLAGGVGVYTLKILSESKASGLRSDASIQYSIVPKGGLAMIGGAPDLSWLGFVLIAIIASLCVRFKIDKS